MAEDPETQTDDPALVEDFDVVVLGTGAWIAFGCLLGLGCCGGCREGRRGDVECWMPPGVGVLASEAGSRGAVGRAATG